MNKFVTRKLEEVKATELVEELCHENQGITEIFETQLAGTTFKSELNTILKYIEHNANGNSCGKRMEILKGVKDGVQEICYKTKHLRCYVIQQPGKKVILHWGIKKKKDSSDNIGSFRNMKKKYLQPTI